MHATQKLSNALIP